VCCGCRWRGRAVLTHAPPPKNPFPPKHSVALNLTCASHVILCDPWWNPAIEQQAGDRCHRLGSTKPVTVVRLIIAGTVEERILALQDKKNAIFQGTVGADASKLAGLSAEDMRFLFSG
jgi:DNA repair protein RAD16